MGQRGGAFLERAGNLEPVLWQTKGRQALEGLRLLRLHSNPLRYLP